MILISDYPEEEEEDPGPINNEPEEKQEVQAVSHEGIFPSKAIEVEINGKHFIAIPKDLYRWIVCIPYGGKFTKKMGINGPKRVPIAHVDTHDDWSLDVDVFFEGNVIGPIKRLELLLDRDNNDRLPIVKMELIG